MENFFKNAEDILIIYFLFCWVLFLIAGFKPKFFKIAVSSFFVLVILLFLRLIVLLYLFLGDRSLTQYLIDVFALFLSLVFVFLPKSFLKNYGVVIPVFLLLLMFLGELVAQLSFKQRINFFSAYGEKFLLFHVLLMLLAYLAFSLNFISSILFIKKDNSLKLRSFDVLDEKNWGIEFLKLINYRLFLSGFVLISLGILSGVAFRISLHPDDFNLTRFGLPLFLWAVCAYVVIDCQKNGVKGRSLAKWTILIFALAMLCLSYELTYVI